MTSAQARIGVAVSGGGFRATAFGLGCLRALHDTGLLASVSVISGISGGSLLAATVRLRPEDFAEFDAMTVDLLRRGLQGCPDPARSGTPRGGTECHRSRPRALPERAGTQPRLRTANRTDALRNELAHRAFGHRTLDQVTHPGLATVITATDLRTSNAVRFGSLRSSCSAYGTINEPVSVADAVAASAAFPLLLPAIERSYSLPAPEFRNRADRPFSSLTAESTTTSD